MIGSNVKLSFDCDQALADQLRDVAFAVDKSKSDVIRFALQLYLPALRARPSIIDHTLGEGPAQGGGVLSPSAHGEQR